MTEPCASGQFYSADRAMLQQRAIAEHVQEVKLEKSPVRGGSWGPVQMLQTGGKEPEQAGVAQTFRQQGIGQLAGVTGKADL